MRNIFLKLIVIFLALTIAAGCSKQIDIKPQFSLDGSKPLATLEDAEFVLTGAYNGFQGAGYFNSSGNANPAAFSCLVDMMSDNLIETFEDFPNYRKLSEWTYTADEGSIQITFDNVYNIISTVNIIIRDIDKIPTVDMDRMNKIKAQAYAIRAMAHFDLLRYFATSFDRNSTAPGVPYVKTFDATALPARNTVQECYDNIFADINTAKAAFALTTTAINSSASRSRIDETVLEALAARVNLYAGQWQAAIDASTSVIADMPIATRAEFPAIWKDQTLKEVVWGVSFQTLADGAPYDNVFFTRGNRCNYRPTTQLASLYTPATDVRYGSYMANIGTFNGIAHASRITVVKYNGRNSSNTVGDGVNDWKVFRTGEMYITRAEAYFKLGNETAARNDLDMLRSNRISGYTSVGETGAALWDAIQTERRKELAFEGHRFFDLKRWNRTPINRCPNVNTPSTVCSLPTDSRSWAWPIPQTEMNTNPNMQQTTGY